MVYFQSACVDQLTESYNVLSFVIIRFTFECRVESDTPSEAKWFKDNLPLASPDYETRYNNGLATLTIEETFSEDTARYTIRITNMAGTAESSAHLNVKGILQLILLAVYFLETKTVN